MSVLLTDSIDASVNPIPIILVHESEWDEWLKTQDTSVSRWLSGQSFEARPGAWSLIPDKNGSVAACIFVHDELNIWMLGDMPQSLPPGTYELTGVENHDHSVLLASGWELGGYQFDRYLSDKKSARASLLVSTELKQACEVLTTGICLVRDLVNTPAQDMMPEQLAEAVSELAGQYGAQFSEYVGKELLEHGFPSIHTVGRASVHTPRLLELNWGREEDPRITLVGKGVCFDSGGLDIKPANAMRQMKKDMGGAAHVLGLARMIMASGLAVHLQVLIPAVENAISGDAFRPGDVLATRKGLTVEVDNTDAEGRLVLSDALTYACESRPELLIDFATLTGAARVALGTEMPGFFTADEMLATELREKSVANHDEVWRLPLHDPYQEQIKSQIADVLNCSTQPFGGAITAALFLRNFVDDGVSWLHFDVMAWNLRSRPGRPQGGEAMGLLSVFDLLKSRYA
jgi:leucyl aminopeptidase